MNAKKLLSLLLAVMMVFCLSASAMADDETSWTAPETQEAQAATNGGTAAITAPDNDHKYYIYQIFAGDLSGTTLSNILWGANGSGTKGQKVSDETIKTLTDNTANKTDVEKLAAINALVGNPIGTPVGYVTKNSSVTLPTGYYMIKDMGIDGAGSTEDKGEISLHMVELVGGITITPKVHETTSNKKVDDKNDSGAITGTDLKDESSVDWKDSADYDIGDDVPFKLEAKITKGYDAYTKYQLTFHDDPCKGLSAPKNMKVFVDDEEIDKSYYTTTVANSAPYKFTVHFDDLKNIEKDGKKLVKPESVITVTYDATLTGDDVVIGKPGNSNKMYVTYSNDANDTQGGENGKTPEDTVVVFTFKTVVNKTQDNPQYVEGGDEPKFIALEGAGFTLFKWNGTEYVKVGEEIKSTTDKPLTAFTFEGLDDGKYKIVETTTPPTYNTAEDIEFVITAEHVLESDNPTLTSLSGKNVSTNANSGLVISKITDDSGVTMDVLNKKGTTLPETGGMGTTLLYVGGVALVAAAAILLIFKKRTSVEK